MLPHLDYSFTAPKINRDSCDGPSVQRESLAASAPRQGPLERPPRPRQVRRISHARDVRVQRALRLLGEPGTRYGAGKIENKTHGQQYR